MERRYPTLSPGSLRFVGHACTHCNLTAPSTGLLPPLWRRKNGTRPFILIGRVPRGFDLGFRRHPGARGSPVHILGTG